jgi:uncharacterized protein
MDKSTYSTVRKYLRRVADRTPGFSRAYLFGSYAKNTQGPESDIDIAMVIRGLSIADKFDTQVQLMLMAAEFDTRIEPHPMSDEELLSSSPFAHEIRRTGIEINLD